MLSSLIITFLPRSKHLLISLLQSPPEVILEPIKIKPATVAIVSPSICHEVMGPDAMILVFWMLSFQPTFSLSPPSIFPSIRVFSNESTLHIRWPKYWSFSFSVSPSNEYSGLISYWLFWSPCMSKGLSRVFSNTTVQKHHFFSTHLSLWSNSHIHIWLLEKP